MTMEIGGRALTAREEQIAVLISRGLSNKEVARTLRIEDATIKAHLHNIYQKLNIRSRTVLALRIVGGVHASAE